jgi:hypothetical protein
MSNQPPEPAKSYTTRLDQSTREGFEALKAMSGLSEADLLRLAVRDLIAKAEKEGGLKISV